MQLSIQNENEKRYLVLNDKDYEDIFSVKMILANRIPGLAMARIRSFNGEMSLYYDISGKQSLADVTKKRKLNSKELIKLFQGILIAIRSVSLYFLWVEDLWFDSDRIYLDEDGVSMIYYPKKEREEDNYFLSLSEWLLAMTDEQDEQAVVLSYQVYMLAKDDKLTLEKLLDYVLSQIEQETEVGQQGAENSYPDEDIKEVSQNSVDNTPSYIRKSKDEEKLAGINREKRNIDWIAFFLFLALFALSFSYGAFLIISFHIIGLNSFLEWKEGIICCVFGIMGILGAVFSFISRFLPTSADDSYH